MNDTLVCLLVSASNQRFLLGNCLSHSPRAISDQLLVVLFLLYWLGPIPALHFHCHALTLESLYLLLSCVSPHESCPSCYQKDFSGLSTWEWCAAQSPSDPLLCPQHHTEDFQNLAPTSQCHYPAPHPRKKTHFSPDIPNDSQSSGCMETWFQHFLLCRSGWDSQQISAFTSSCYTLGFSSISSISIT